MAGDIRADEFVGTCLSSKMEAAGLMGKFRVWSSVVSDYADSHKNKRW
jgi:hypothetical protein